MSAPTAAPGKPARASFESKSHLSASLSASTLLSASAPNALYNFRLLEALRSDDPKQVQPFLDELKGGSTAGQAPGPEDEDKAGRLLGMAVRVASVPIIHLILSSPAIPSPNLPISSGSTTTPLHVASEIGRADVVHLLLNHPKIEDTSRDDRGRTPLEAAANSEVAAIIEESRTSLQLRFLSLLANYVPSALNSVEEGMAMGEFLEGPRTEILNLNALDERSGTSLLHEAARRRDLRLVELAVKRGADVFVRDKRGKRVLEGEKNMDERIRVYLRQFNNQDNLVHAKTDGRPPDLNGFLSKWVNYRSGWRTRWFVLENGVLSYYRNREDEAVACRGSIALASASLHPSTDGSRFEIHSRASSSVPKFIVKSAHRAEIARWVQTIRLNIEHYSKEDDTAAKPGEVLDKRSSTIPRRTNSFLSTTSERPVSTMAAMPKPDSFLSADLKREATSLSGLSVPPSMAPKDSPPSLNDDANETMSIFEAAEKESLVGQDEQRPASYGIPHETSYDLGVLNIKAQLELSQQLVDSIATSPATLSSGSASQGAASQTTPAGQEAVKEALRSSLQTLSLQISQQSVMSQDRERYLLGRIQREIEARKLWEENMLTVAEQQADMDRQLTEAARDNEKKRRALRQARGVLAGLSGGSLPTSPAPEAAPGTAGGSVSGILDKAVPEQAPITPATMYTAPLASATTRGSISNIQEVHDAVVAAGADSDSDNEDDDEFFDAIEQNAIPNLRLHDSIAHPERPGTPVGTRNDAAVPSPTPNAVSDGKTVKDLLARKSLEPYLHVRHKLPIDDDKRPSVSLWSILKSSVGKDLTKISFPVSFNECTSMLQRMAEDMEYDACLTVAAGEADSLKRIAFVAAFAMSNYSSTIGRIAKPFNPLLSQSFEYAIPGRYRYISEQVSHHPPISACYCEAPTWKYYGEVDAQNKFQGRSFEIRPTGVAHAELVIPKRFVKAGLEYPDAGAEYGEDLVLEHYSWKKVTTNVSNFIMGTPIIDHYGDLVVTNHRTGETCTLTFKPRGWRGGNAFEIKGNVVNNNGHTAWDIAGRWDSQLIAREASSSAPLEVDTKFQPTQKEYLLLWRNSEKPAAPFNLTPYAITLNDIPNGLRPYLCPTDCRLRTDQRAFENAQYDKAQMLKSANEEKQRNTRKLRAEGKLPSHEPRWFSAGRDDDCGERTWYPRRAEDGEVLFWSEREKAGAKGEWDGVDHIFAEDVEA